LLQIEKGIHSVGRHVHRAYFGFGNLMGRGEGKASLDDKGPRQKQGILHFDLEYLGHENVDVIAMN